MSETTTGGDAGMCGDAIPTTTMAVYVQENGIIRAKSNGRYIARLDGVSYADIQPLAHSHVIYGVDEMEHILNCFDNLFFIDEQPPETRKTWLKTIHEACHNARQKWLQVVKRGTETESEEGSR